MNAEMKNLEVIIFWSFLLQSSLISQVQSSISRRTSFSGNELLGRSGSTPRYDIPSSLIGSATVPKTDVPGEPLDPNDFLRGADIRIVQAPEINGEDPIFAAKKFQGDIEIPLNRTAHELNENVVSDQPLHNAIIKEDGKWINAVIPYVIAAAYDTNERAIIAKAIAAFHQKTCIRFVPRNNEPDYIFIRKAIGCSSSVGRVTGEQTVSLGDGCIYHGIVIHELMHAVGFWHEQSRADRDSYVTIIWSNIIKGMEFNFQKYDWNIIQNLGTSYDTGSIMHYGPHSFAIDRKKPTIVANNGQSIGQRNDFSANDAKKINLLYQCSNYLVDENGSVTEPTVVTTTEATGCADGNVHCQFWADQGECTKNPAWMSNNCKKSCKNCGIKACKDDNDLCESWRNGGHCRKSASYMNKHCRKSCGICGNKGTTSTSCTDSNKFCEAWAKSGECRANPSYMQTQCKKSCNSC